MKIWVALLRMCYVSFDDLVICMDEAHRYYAPASKKAINYLNPVLGLEYTATSKSTNKKYYLSLRIRGWSWEVFEDSSCYGKNKYSRIFR